MPSDGRNTLADAIGAPVSLVTRPVTRAGSWADAADGATTNARSRRSLEDLRISVLVSNAHAKTPIDPDGMTRRQGERVSGGRNYAPVDD
jgi:hypothetical protein